MDSTTPVCSEAPACLEPLVSLEGWYGEGNLGDDILMKVSYSVLRDVFRSPEISVKTTGRPYVRSLLGAGCVQRRELAPPSSVRAVLVGGGGLFFGFQNNGLIGRVGQAALQISGLGPFHRARSLKHDIMSLLYGTRRPSKLFRVAFGIGVGPFVAGSRRELRAALQLSRNDLIVVRDIESEQICRSWRLPSRVVRATDIAFELDRWLPSSCVAMPHDKPRQKNLTIVVRDWPSQLEGAMYFDALLDAVRKARRDSFRIRFCSLNPENDLHVLNLLEKHAEDVLYWDPSGRTLEDFLMEFAETDLVITSRAHGALVAACLGIPSICIGIERKMQAVAEMLDGIPEVWGPPFDPDALLSNIHRSMECYSTRLYYCVLRCIVIPVWRVAAGEIVATLSQKRKSWSEQHTSMREPKIPVRHESIEQLQSHAEARNGI